MKKVICLVCNTEIKSAAAFSRHLICQHNITQQIYYDKYLKKETEGVCEICGNATEFINIQLGYKTTCCKECRYKRSIAKSHKTQIEKYGCLAFNTEKQKQTMLEKYGAENPFASEEIKKKLKETWKKKYGTDHPLKNKEKANEAGKRCSETKKKIREDFEKLHQNLIPKKTLTDKYGWMWYWNNVVEPIKVNLAGRFVNYYKQEDITKIESFIEETIHNNRSHQEMRLLDFVKSIYSGEIKHDCKSIISPKEIDIYLPELKLGIEYNGTRYHSIELGAPKNYHLNKSIECRNKGIRLIHIYEFEDLEEQKQLLKDLVEGKDNYPPQDFNKNNLLDFIPRPCIIYKKDYTIYGAGKLY